MRTVFATILVLLGASLPLPAAACSCAPLTVAELHGKARVLVLVKVGAAVPLVEADGRAYQTWPYELIDTYKGQLRAEWLWSWVDGLSCDTHLAAGAYYLVSTNDDGHVRFCDVRRLAEDPSADGDIKALNALAEGSSPAPTQP